MDNGGSHLKNKSCPVNGQWEEYNWFSHSMTPPTGQEEEYSWSSHRMTPLKKSPPDNKGIMGGLYPNENNNETPKVILVQGHKLTSTSSTVSVTHQVKSIKTKKCQPADGDLPDLIQTVHVPSSGLARPQIKINRTEKIKLKIQDIAEVTLVRKVKLTNSSSKLSNSSRTASRHSNVDTSLGWKLSRKSRNKLMYIKNGN